MLTMDSHSHRSEGSGRVGYQHLRWKLPVKETLATRMVGSESRMPVALRGDTQHRGRWQALPSGWSRSLELAV